MEEERDRLFSTGVVTDQRADLGGAGVGDGNDLDEMSGIDGLGLGGGEQGVNVNIPLGHQPQQRLGSNDGPREHEGPFLALNVGIISLGREIEAEKHGPDNQKRPDVGVQLQWEGVMQRRILDLGVIREFCPETRLEEHDGKGPGDIHDGNRVTDDRASEHLST